MKRIEFKITKTIRYEALLPNHRHNWIEIRAMLWYNLWTAIETELRMPTKRAK